MTLPTLPSFPPLADSEQEAIQLKVHSANFGDGYRQDVAAGINAERANGGWRFPCTPANAATMMAFLRANGITGFLFQPPADVSVKKYKCFNFRPIWITAERTDVVAQFEQIYDPDSIIITMTPPAAQLSIGGEAPELSLVAVEIGAAFLEITGTPPIVSIT